MSLIELGQQLLEAAQRGETDLIKQLMCNGAPFTTDWFGTTPLHLAAQNGHIETAEVLIKAGITIDTKTKLSRAPLHMAAQAGFLDMAKLLIQNGASINIKDMLNMTPLHWAVESGDLALVEYLLQNGASTSVINKFDKTPIDIAINKYRTDMVNLLKNAEQIQQAHQEELIIEHDSQHQIPMHDANGCFYNSSPLYGTSIPQSLDKSQAPLLPSYNGAQNLFNNKRKLQMSFNSNNMLGSGNGNLGAVTGNKLPHQIYNRTALSNNILFAINDNYRLKHHRSNQHQPSTLRLLPTSGTPQSTPKVLGSVGTGTLGFIPTQQIKEEFVGGFYEESNTASLNAAAPNFKMESSLRCETSQDQGPPFNKRFRVQTANGLGLGPGHNRGPAQLCRPGTAPINSYGGGGNSNNTLNIINRDNVKMFLNNLNHFNTTTTPNPISSAPNYSQVNTSAGVRTGGPGGGGQNRILPHDLSRTIILGPNPQSQARNNLVGVGGLVRINTGPCASAAQSSTTIFTTTTTTTMIYVKQAVPLASPLVNSSSAAAVKKGGDDSTNSDYPMYILTQTGKIISSKDLLSQATPIPETPSPLLNNVTRSLQSTSTSQSKSVNDPQELFHPNVLLSPTTEKALNIEAQSALSSLSKQDDIGVAGQLGILEHSKYVQRIYSKADVASIDSVRIVVGNEACDLDSAICSLVYAYFLYQQNDFPLPNNLIIPLFNIQSGDYKLKTEVKYYLEKLGINQDHLIFRDNDHLDIKDLHAKQKLLLILVDHNTLPSPDKYLASSVVEIIDHHHKEPSWADQYCDILIEYVGSCCTLVAEKVLHKEPCILDAMLIEMLYGAIILDTICLNPKAGRAKPKDLEIVSRLESHLPGLYGNRLEIYQNLVGAKTDISRANIHLFRFPLGLTDLEILRKDLKSARSPTMTIGVASFPLLVEEVMESRRATFLDSMSQFCQTNEFQLLVILGIKLSPNPDIKPERNETMPHRDLGIYSENVFFREQLCDFLLQLDEDQSCSDFDGNLGKIQLELEVTKSPWPELLSLMTQGNYRASRKQLLPLLQKFLLGEGENRAPTSQSTTEETFSFFMEDLNGLLIQKLDSPLEHSTDFNDLVNPEDEELEQNEDSIVYDTDTLNKLEQKTAPSWDFNGSGLFKDNYSTQKPSLDVDLASLVNAGNIPGNDLRADKIDKTVSETNLDHMLTLKRSMEIEDFTNVTQLNQNVEIAKNNELSPSLLSETTVGFQKEFDKTPRSSLDELARNLGVQALEKVLGQSDSGDYDTSEPEYNSNRSSDSLVPISPLSNTTFDLLYHDNTFIRGEINELLPTVRFKKGDSNVGLGGDKESSEPIRIGQGGHVESNDAMVLNDFIKQPDFYTEQDSVINDEVPRENDIDTCMLPPDKKGGETYYSKDDNLNGVVFKQILKDGSKNGSSPLPQPKSVWFNPQYNTSLDIYDLSDSPPTPEYHRITQKAKSMSRLDDNSYRSELPASASCEENPISKFRLNAISSLENDIDTGTFPPLKNDGQTLYDNTDDLNGAIYNQVVIESETESGTDRDSIKQPNGYIMGPDFSTSLDIFDKNDAFSFNYQNPKPNSMQNLSGQVKLYPETFNKNDPIDDRKIRSENSNSMLYHPKHYTSPNMYESFSESLNRQGVVIEKEKLGKNDIDTNTFPIDKSENPILSDSYDELNGQVYERCLTPLADSKAKCDILMDSHFSTSLDYYQSYCPNEIFSPKRHPNIYDQISDKLLRDLFTLSYRAVLKTQRWNQVNRSECKFKSKYRHMKRAFSEGLSVQFLECPTITITPHSPIIEERSYKEWSSAHNPNNAPLNREPIGPLDFGVIEKRWKWKDDNSISAMTSIHAHIENEGGQSDLTGPLNEVFEGSTKMNIVYPEKESTKEISSENGDKPQGIVAKKRNRFNLCRQIIDYDKNITSTAEQNVASDVKVLYLNNGQSLVLSLKDRDQGSPKSDVNMEHPSSPQDEIYHEIHYKIDMERIEPYKRIITLGGYSGEDKSIPIIYVSACYLPSRYFRDYENIMEHIFFYIIKTLHALVEKEYIVIFFEGSAPKDVLPTFKWLKKYYGIVDHNKEIEIIKQAKDFIRRNTVDSIITNSASNSTQNHEDTKFPDSLDRKLSYYTTKNIQRLRKNLKFLCIVHPSFWIRSMCFMCRPFINNKLWKKITFVHSLKDLCEIMDLDLRAIPDVIKQYDMDHTRK